MIKPHEQNPHYWHSEGFCIYTTNLNNHIATSYSIKILNKLNCAAFYNNQFTYNYLCFNSSFAALIKSCTVAISISSIISERNGKFSKSGASSGSSVTLPMSSSN